MSKKAPIPSFTLIVAFLCVAFVGIAFIPLTPVKLNPSEQMPSINVTYSMQGNSARIIESQVTSKLESMLSRIKGVRGIYSNSGEGWGNIWLDFDAHTHMDHARFEAATIIRQAWPGLPAGTSYPQIQIRKSDEGSSRPFISYALNAPAPPSSIQHYAEEVIKPRLSQLEGVYKVEVSGATPMEWQLEYDPEELTRLGISGNTLITALSQAYQKEFLGICSQGPKPSSETASPTGKLPTQWIRIALHPSVTEEGFDASRIHVPLPDGKRIGLERLLLRITHQEETPSAYYRINGLHSIYLSVTAEDRANQLTVGRNVRNEIQHLTRLLPAGYQFHLSYDATEYIRQELEKIYIRTGLTVLILLLFVGVISRNPRYTLLILCSLVMSVFIAVIFYYLFKLEMQLYSLAGITLSLNLIIDSTIIMADHLMRERNRNAFLPILAATLTTMGSLVLIFFLDEKIRLNLQDFAAVIMINLAVSLVVALFLVPALIDKMKLGKSKKNKRISRRDRRRILAFSRFYRWQILFLGNKKKWVFLFFLLLFGLPVFLLPDRLQEDPENADWKVTLYNKTLGSEFYNEKLRPVIDPCLGGSWRLFVQKVYEGSYFTKHEEVTLTVNATLPNGSTLEQMNTLVGQMEQYLSQFDEIRQFQTHIQNARRASIQIYFREKSPKSSFPYLLKANIISRALQLGGGSWQVYGLDDHGFSNEVTESAGSYRIKMFGYNYEALYAEAERLRDTLLTHRRIKEVNIRSDFSWWKDDYQEFFFRLHKQHMAEEGIPAQTLFANLHPLFRSDLTAGTVFSGNQTEYLKLSSRQSQEYDIWHMVHIPLRIHGKEYKLSELAAIEKEQAPQQVSKENQQYRLCLQYEYIGSSIQARRVLERDLEHFRKGLPPGYTVHPESHYGGWGSNENKQYRLLFLVVAIVFLTTGVLFNSLKKPFIVLLIIPVSFIGVFLTFYGFRLNFDQGGFASFILLCGITVNATIYLLSEYEALRKRHPSVAPVQIYLKAWNRKIVPIFLTVVSTVLGFIPFMVGLDKEAFWFPLAAGTIGGLMVSVAGIYLILPLTLKEVRKKPSR